MRRIGGIVLLAGLWLGADAASASAQVFYGPVGYGGYSYGYQSGFSFGFHGRHFAFGGGWSGGYRYSYPAYGPVAVGPWGAFGGFGGVNPWGWNPYYYAPPVLFAAPPVIVVPFGGGVIVGANNNAWNPPALALRPPDPVPAGVPPVPAKVDAAVRRGDLLVVRPNGEGVRPAFALEPKPEPAPAKPHAGFAREVPPAPAAPPPADAKGRATFEVAKAKDAFAAGEFGRAAERLAEAIQAAPNESLPYFLLAQARTARGEYAAAVAAIKEGLRRDPDWPAATFKLKAIYGPNAAAFDEHLADLVKAAAADPDDPTLGFLAGYHQWFLGQTAEAVRLFKKATKQVKDNGVIERFLLEAEGKKL